MRIFLRKLVLVKRERNEKEKKKKLPWFLLIKSLLLNQSLFWGRHSTHLKKFLILFTNYIFSLKYLHLMSMMKVAVESRSC